MGTAPTAWAFSGVGCPAAGAAFGSDAPAVLAVGGAAGTADFAVEAVAAEGLAVVFSDISGIGRLFADGVIIFYGFVYLIKKDNLAAIQHACNVAMLLDGANLV